MKFFNPGEGEIIVDCTAGFLGHTRALEKAGAKVIALDRCPQFKRVKKANFRDLGSLIKKPVFGVLFDLGLCSWQIDESGKGFSYLKDEPLDMRLGESDRTAHEVVNNYPEKDLTEIFKEYGEEPKAHLIAREIVKHRPLRSTKELADLIWGIKSKARIFQAVRIEVNDELRALDQGLEAAMKLAKKIAVISYHSLEDRIVKNKFKNKILIRPQPEEVKKNSRSRSAKLRIYINDQIQ